MAQLSQQKIIYKNPLLLSPDNPLAFLPSLHKIRPILQFLDPKIPPSQSPTPQIRVDNPHPSIAVPAPLPKYVLQHPEHPQQPLPYRFGAGGKCERTINFIGPQCVLFRMGQIDQR